MLCLTNSASQENPWPTHVRLWSKFPEIFRGFLLGSGGEGIEKPADILYFSKY